MESSLTSGVSAVCAERDAAAPVQLAEVPRELVLVLGWTHWDGVCRRRYHTTDRLAAAVLGDPRIERVLVVNPWRSAPRRAVRWLRGDHGEPFPADETRTLYQPFRLRGEDPRSPAGARRSYRSYGRYVRIAAAAAGLQRPAVICLNPLAAGFADFGWAGAISFFAEDDFAAVDALAPWRGAIEHAYRRIAADGTAVGGVTDAIVERIGGRGPSAVVPNGVDPGEWWRLPATPDWLAALPGPRVLYLGVANERIDAAAVAAIARRHPEGSIVFVGGLRPPEHLAELFARPNVHFRPHVSRAEVPAVVAGADVCIVPHRVTPLTEAMSPLKVYEYLAAGRPVVATELAPIRGIDERVTLVPSGGDFADGVDAALAGGTADDDERHAFITTHCWDRRIEQILALNHPRPSETSART